MKTIKNYDTFINEEFNGIGKNKAMFAFKALEMTGGLMTLTGKEDTIHKFIESVKETDFSKNFEDKTYSFGIDLSEYGYNPIDYNGIVELNPKRNNPVLVYINSAENPDNVAEILMKSSIKLDLEQIELK